MSIYKCWSISGDYLTFWVAGKEEGGVGEGGNMYNRQLVGRISKFQKVVLGADNAGAPEESPFPAEALECLAVVCF
jgi:hypothetical protein